MYTLRGARGLPESESPVYGLNKANYNRLCQPRSGAGMAGRQMQSSYVTFRGAAQYLCANWGAFGTNWRRWMRSQSDEASSSLISYGTIIAAVLVTALVQTLSASFLDERTQFLIYVPAVLTAAFLGGFRLGAMVTLLSLATTLDSLGETEGNDLRLLFNGLAFSIVALGLSVFGDKMHRARRETRKHNQDLTSILEIMPGAMVVLDDAGTLQKFNRAAEQLFGYSAGEVIGRRAEKLIENWQVRPCPAPADAFGSPALRYRGHGLRKDGSSFPIELVLGEWRSGSRLYFVGLAVDLTERQHTDARLAALQGELIHASRLSLMGTMASAMAHELNQPLSAITNYIKGLKHTVAREEEEEPPRFTAILDKTADQALRAGQIIGRLRTLVARGESERRLETIGRLIEETSTLALPGTREHGVEMTFTHEAEGEQVLVDRIQIQQVLLNLIRNATEAMTQSERRVLAVSATLTGDSLTVRVEDTGAGIPADIASRLFTPFVTTKQDGMGIGLSISRTIIEAHGGKMWYEAAPGGGAAFSFTLPRIARDELDYAA